MSPAWNACSLIAHSSQLIAHSSMRISAISYLNTAPLMWDFEHGAAGDQFNISYTVPSQCARELQNGKADIGIIPSAAYASIPGLLIISGMAIASKQAVRSILLVSRKPMAEIQTIALDSSSLTSVALARILFKKFWGGSREFSSAPPNLDSMLSASDAALLIGDPALVIDRTRYLTWDLAEEWLRFTGKPFVFAFWAVRQGAAQASNLDLKAIFQKSRDHGLEPSNLNRIAQDWSTTLKLPAEDLYTYLTSNIFYYLDEPCLDGLRMFYRYAHECNALPLAPELNFANTTPALI
jgi:chorismate dehydratase